MSENNPQIRLSDCARKTARQIESKLKPIEIKLPAGVAVDAMKLLYGYSELLLSLQWLDIKTASRRYMYEDFLVRDASGMACLAHWAEGEWSIKGVDFLGDNVPNLMTDEELFKYFVEWRKI